MTQFPTGFLHLFEYDGHGATQDKDTLIFGNATIPIRDGIPRFTPDESYSTGNFAKLRERHATLQLDSVNGTQDRMDTLLERTQWPREFFKDKLILECGCGAGPDTEVLLALGARVVSVDLAGLDVARENLQSKSNSCLVQASIADLPFKKESFDIVFCHRVLMHTPAPVKILGHMLQFVKPSGAVFVHSYSRDFRQRFRWKYAMRPITKRMDPERLYKIVETSASFLYPLTTVLNSSRIGRRLGWIFIPFLNHNYKEKFKGQSDEQMRAYAVHDTFDALSPPYDNPVSEADFHAVASTRLKTPYEVVTAAAVTFLRSTWPTA